MLAPFFTPYVVKSFFEEAPKLNFFNFACSLHSYKLYLSSCKDKIKINCLTKDDFTGKVLKELPDRLQKVIEDIKIPEYKDIETASTLLFHVKPMD